MSQIRERPSGRGLGLILLAAILSACGGGQGDTEYFHALLRGSDEVPPNASLFIASGSFDVVKGKRIDYSAPSLPIVASGILGVHVHAGDPGEQGPIIFTLHQDSSPGLASFSGSWTVADLAPDLAAGIVTFADAVHAIEEGHAYVNLQTKEFPGGEIRGQIVPGRLGPVGSEGELPPAT
jgi:hypothetical protein